MRKEQQCKHGKCRSHSFQYKQSHVTVVWFDKTAWLTGRCCGQGMQKGYREVVAFCSICGGRKVIGGARLLFCGCCEKTLVTDSWGDDKANQWRM